MELSEGAGDSGNSVQTEWPQEFNMACLSRGEGRGRGWRGDAAALQPECRAPVAICYRLQERLFTRFIAASDTNYWISFPT